MFRKIFVSHLILLAVCIALSGIAVAKFAHDKIIEEIEARLESNINVAIPAVGDCTDLAGRPRLQELTVALSSQSSARVTVIAADGRVLADSEVNPALMDLHNDRPEVTATRQKGSGSNIRFSRSVGYDMLYVAKLLDPTDPSGVVLRMSLPLRNVKAEIADIYWYVALVFLVVGLGIAATDYVALRRIMSPLSEIKRVAEAITAGDLTRRSPLLSAGEIGALSAAMNRMGEELSRRMDALREEKAKLEALLAGMQEGVIAIDSNGNIMLCNTAAEELMDATQDGIGRPFWETTRTDEVISLVRAALSNQKAEKREVELRGRRLLLRAQPIRNGGGILLVAHDVTDLKRYDDLRKEFVANVSHEIRTPLTLVKGWIETLRRGAIDNPAEAQEFLSTIEKHLNQLTNLVEDLLDLSRLESQSGLLRLQTVQPARLAQKVAESYRQSIDRKQQKLALNLASESQPLRVDPDMIERALSNLVDNAVKYTPEGGTITIACRPVEAGVEITVSDTGIGIPEKDLPRIFERFYRVDKSRSREMGGTGLGLAIVKHIVLLHHGEVSAHSVAGEGSRFTIRLPLDSGAL